MDAAFTGLSNIQTVTGSSATINLTVTMGAQAAEAGVTTFTFSDTGAAETLTVGAGFTTDLTVNLDSDATAGNTITGTGYTGALSVAADASEMDSNASTLTGGSGGDTL